jgi:dTDP-4-amino-4,6-dideoxygalactose transaminase
VIRTFDDLELGYLREVLDRGQLGWIIPGGLQERFEQEFARFMGSKVAMSRNNAMNGLAEAIAVSGAGIPYAEVFRPCLMARRTPLANMLP